MKQSSFILFLLLIFCAFSLDMASFLFAEKQLIYAVLCLLVIQVLRPISLPRLAILTALMCLESFLYYGRFALPLIYIIPLIALGINIRRTCYVTTTYRYMLLIACLLVNYVIIERFILHLPHAMAYTISKVFVTLVLLTVLSWLKI